MRMTGEQRIAASREQVWQGLNDPEVLRRCIPGCQSLDKESDQRLRATVEIKIGPIGARFTGAVTLSDLDPPNGYTITGEGQGGTVGSAKGGAKVRLAKDGNGTVLSYEVDAQVGGRLAQLGGPVIDATAKQLAGRFFKQFGEIVGGSGGTAPSTQPANASASTAPANLSQPASDFPVAWVAALVVAALVGFLVGKGQGGTGSEWLGLSIGLLVVVAATAGFLCGRRLQGAKQ